jgi:multidrug resistance efflux pump
MNAALESGEAGVGEMAAARQPARGRQMLVAILLAAAGVVAGVLTYRSLASSPASFGGEIVPTRVYSLSFQATGTVAAVNVHAGQSVTAGQVLASQNNSLAQANLQSAQSLLSERQAALQQAQGLGQTVAIAHAQQQLEAAKIQVTQDQAAVRATQVVAPASGFVGAVAATAGESITSGNLHAPIVTLDSGPLIVTAHLPNTEIGVVRAGQKVTLDVQPLHVNLPGQVLQVNQVVTQSQTAVSYVMTCQIEARDPALLAGMAVSITPQ